MLYLPSQDAEPNNTHESVTSPTGINLKRSILNVTGGILPSLALISDHLDKPVNIGGLLLPPLVGLLLFGGIGTYLNGRLPDDTPGKSAAGIIIFAGIGALIGICADLGVLLLSR